MSEKQREIRIECLRPGQLNEERKRCPLVFVPIGPLEYHGPHLPVGMDAISATQCALEACRRFGRGVVHPTLFWGTERERPDWMLESLGFERSDWIIGMDFPTATWKSHYYHEHLFALVVASAIEMLIQGGYKVIVLVNGHGAWNQLETLDRLAKHYSNSTDALVAWRLAFTLDVSEKNLAGHADLFETSMMLYYQQVAYGSVSMVDLSRLPERGVPIRYPDLSIVDGPGFSENPSPGRVVQTDPRDATAEKGRKIFEDTAQLFVKIAEEALKMKKLG
ncbi:MAG: creatininase family protein [Spirochaetales bacterium]|nr:creatininase family protein [Spirochaetales bacterium]